MRWMAATAAIRKDPTSYWDWARSALVGALSYREGPDDRADAPGITRFVARYARGADYHDELRARLARWGDEVERLAGRPVRRKPLADTSPLLERELAVRAGLGWFGKNTCLIASGGDSWRVLGVLLTDLELPETGEPAAERCGSCVACLDACPTGAITEPWFVDARRCLSYWTIEHRGEIPAEFHAPLGDWLFGCDVCQDVCPWNRRVAPGAPGGPFSADPRLASLTLSSLLRLDDRGVRDAVRGTALMRPKRTGLLRNALLVAENTGDGDGLAEAPRLADDADPVIASTARAVLGRSKRSPPGG
jgi:epoxyqueuosine reductase